MLEEIMIMKPVALQCVIGGPCKFKTIKLEFAQAFQLLVLHMKYLHSPKANDERDEILNHEENLEEGNLEIDQLFEETEEAKLNDIEEAVVHEDDPVNEAKQSEFADVTSVRDDRDVRYQGSRRRIHYSNPVDNFQENVADVTLVPDDREEVKHPVGNHHPCGGCGESSHSSDRASRRKFCPGWNKYCQLCSKRGHL